MCSRWNLINYGFVQPLPESTYISITTKRPPCATTLYSHYVPFPFIPNLGQQFCFLNFKFFFFQECYIIEIIQNVTFWKFFFHTVWYPWLSMWTVLSILYSILKLSSIPLHRYISLLIHLPKVFGMFPVWGSYKEKLL